MRAITALFASAFFVIFYLYLFFKVTTRRQSADPEEPSILSLYGDLP